MRINKLASAACLVLLSLPAMANEVYTYTGNTMNVTYVSGGGYTTTDKVTGSFITSSPLAANLALADISFLSYSFNDGVQTMTNTNSSEYGSPNGFEIATDASGNITSWNIVLNIASTLDFINTSNDSVGDGMHARQWRDRDVTQHHRGRSWQHSGCGNMDQSCSQHNT